MQRKLTSIEIVRITDAIEALQRVRLPGPILNATVVLLDDFNRMLEHGTSDGRPWVDPERPIERGEWVAVYDATPAMAFAVGRYLGDIGENKGGCRHGIIGRSALWQSVRRATSDEIARAEATQ
jgi:hypothetical protein